MVDTVTREAQVTEHSAIKVIQDSEEDMAEDTEAQVTTKGGRGKADTVTSGKEDLDIMADHGKVDMANMEECGINYITSLEDLDSKVKR